MSARASTIVDDIYKALQGRILSGALPAGTRLPAERELATEFHTNRNTLREAIRRLEQDRMVSVRHGQGVTVCDFRRTGTIDLLEPFLAHGGDATEKMSALRDLLSFRTMVLESAIVLAVDRATAADHERLHRLTRVLRGAFAAQDRDALAEGFHEWLEALVDSSHSLTARWAANPYLDLNRSFTGRFPSLWITDEAFPEYLEACARAVSEQNAEAGVAATRAYYAKIDGVILAAMNAALPFMVAQPSPESGAES
jgi:DNA-binding FadR family transcriptional regulator